MGPQKNSYLNSTCTDSMVSLYPSPKSSLVMQSMQSFSVFILWQLQKSCSAYKDWALLFLTIARIYYRSRVAVKSRNSKHQSTVLRPSEGNLFLLPVVIGFIKYYSLKPQRILREYIPQYKRAA